MFYHFDAPKKSGFLLDKVKNAAAAYSLRKLKSTATRAIRVRRSVDNAEQDFGFDARGELDAATLMGFVNGGDGYVTNWYDQSGNGNHATQASISSQPQLLSNGQVNLQNGKPSIKFTGTNQQYLDYDGSFLANTSYSISMIEARNASTLENYILGGTTMAGNRNLHFGYRYSNELNHAQYQNDMYTTVEQFTTQKASQYSVRMSSTNRNVYGNGVLLNSQTSSQTLLSSYAEAGIGRYGANRSYYTGNLSELVLYNSYLSDPARLAIEADQMKYFNISGM